jgi:hypothetical protein
MDGRTLQRVGGVSALVAGAIYLVAIVYFFFLVDYASVVDPLPRVEFLVENEVSLYVMNLLIYVVFGIVLVVLRVALYERLRRGASALMGIAAAFGLVWAGLVIASGMIANVGTAVVVDLYADDPNRAATVWLAIDAVVEGVGGGNEIVGGLWTLLVSAGALRAGDLHRILNYFGVLVGLSGLLSAVPPLAEVGGGLFGITQLLWFVGLGALMIRSDAGERRRSR